MINVAIFYADQCDKKKCTSIKLHNNKNKLPVNLIWLTNPKSIRKNSIVLTPNSQTYLLHSDSVTVDSTGITILDCSWKKGQKYLKDWTYPRGRVLPPLLASNPVNYGRWEKLTSAEALIASLIITGKKELAFTIITIFPWGENFYKLNKILFEQYLSCNSQEEIKQKISEINSKLLNNR